MDLIEKNTTSVIENGKAFYVVRKLDKLESKKMYCTFKRIFDFFASLIAILVLALPMILIALCIVIDSPGGAVYSQERMGLDGKKFTVYKFRTMKKDAEKDGAQWAHENDDRCTKVGRFLRQTRLDELMQLFNILKGDMSVVGPRPERECFYEEFSSYIDGFEQRLCVIPGLTGLAQITGGYDFKPEEKIAYDLEYIEKRSFLLDIKLIFQTIAVVLGRKHAR